MCVCECVCVRVHRRRRHARIQICVCACVCLHIYECIHTCMRRGVIEERSDFSTSSSLGDLADSKRSRRSWRRERSRGNESRGSGGGHQFVEREWRKWFFAYSVPVCDCVLSNVWHNSLICGTWLFHRCEWTHTYVGGLDQLDPSRARNGAAVVWSRDWDTLERTATQSNAAIVWRFVNSRYWHAATHCITLQRCGCSVISKLQHTATLIMLQHTLQHTLQQRCNVAAVFVSQDCDTLQDTATHSNTLQHTATL